MLIRLSHNLLELEHTLGFKKLADELFMKTRDNIYSFTLTQKLEQNFNG